MARFNTPYSGADGYIAIPPVLTAVVLRPLAAIVIWLGEVDAITSAV